MKEIQVIEQMLKALTAIEDNLRDDSHLRRFPGCFQLVGDAIVEARSFLASATLDQVQSEVLQPMVDRCQDLLGTARWSSCADSLPDSDTTVMTFAPGSAEPIWPAYHDGEQWFDLNGAPIDDAAITHWMDFPEPPECQ